MHENESTKTTNPSLPSPHVGLSDLGDDLTRLLERLQHLRRLLPPLADVLALGEEALDLIRLVEAGHKLALEVVLHEVHGALGAVEAGGGKRAAVGLPVRKNVKTGHDQDATLVRIPVLQYDVSLVPGRVVLVGGDLPAVEHEQGRAHVKNSGKTKLAMSGRLLTWFVLL